MNAIDQTRPRVAAVFASYRRKEVALECLKRLRAQTRSLAWVVVGDNASADGSVEAMEALGWDRLVVVDTGGNWGNAGAVKAAMERAFELGADAVWILDDDSWPRVDALERMLEGGWDEDVVLHPMQMDPVSGRLTWPLQVVGDGGEVGLVAEAGELPAEGRVKTRGVWTGALISRKVREVAGPVMAELFIRGEDEEYPWRVERAGFRTEGAVRAWMDHPGPPNLVEWCLFGRRLFLERGLVDWKLYYKVRNMVWLKKQQGGVCGALLMALAYGVALCRVEGLGRLKVWSEAVRDGWAGRLGRWKGA